MEITNPAALRLIEELRKEKEEKLTKQRIRKNECKKEWVAKRPIEWKEKQKAYKREYARKWRIANPERAQEATRKWRAANPKFTNEYNKKWRETNPERYKELRCISNYGIPLKELEVIFIKQGSCCACCKTTESGKRGWHTDHCHITGIVRGILCSNCNLALGHIKDNIITLENMITYLKQYSTGEQHASRDPYPRPVVNTARTRDSS